MSINNNIGEYNIKTFIYISCTIVFRYFVYTGFKNVLASCLLYFLILCAELYVLMLQNNYTLSYFYKCGPVNKQSHVSYLYNNLDIWVEETTIKYV